MKGWTTECYLIDMDEDSNYTLGAESTMPLFSICFSSARLFCPLAVLEFEHSSLTLSARSSSIEKHSSSLHSS